MLHVYAQQNLEAQTIDKCTCAWWFIVCSGGLHGKLVHLHLIAYRMCICMQSIVTTLLATAVIEHHLHIGQLSFRLLKR